MKTKNSLNALNALCALMNKNISRDTTAIDLLILDLEADIEHDRSFSDTIYCGWGSEHDALTQERAWILEGFYTIEDNQIVWDAPWLH